MSRCHGLLSTRGEADERLWSEFGHGGGGWRCQGLWTLKHRSTQQEQVSYNAKGVGTQDMAAMFDNITKSLSFLAARVELLEGGPDQKNR